MGYIYKWLQTIISVDEVEFIIDVQHHNTCRCNLWECVRDENFEFEIIAAFPYKTETLKQAIMKGFQILSEKAPEINFSAEYQSVGCYGLFYIFTDDTNWQLYSMNIGTKIVDGKTVADVTRNKLLADGAITSSRNIQKKAFELIAQHTFDNSHWWVINERKV